MNKVAISGLSAAGKTTHTYLLARALGFETVHFTDVLLEILGIPGTPFGQVWLHRLHEIEAMRDGGGADADADELIVNRMVTEEGLVVDSILSPWLGPDDAVRIWIGSDRLSRSWKCIVSSLPDYEIDTVRAVNLLDEKDGLMRSRFLRDRGIDCYTDRSPFDFVLDNSHVISAPTRAASHRGIEIFHEVLLACALAGLTGDWSRLQRLLATEPACAGCIVSIGSRMRRSSDLTANLYSLGPAPLPTRML